MIYSANQTVLENITCCHVSKQPIRAETQQRVQQFFAVLPQVATGEKSAHHNIDHLVSSSCNTSMDLSDVQDDVNPLVWFILI